MLSDFFNGMVSFGTDLVKDMPPAFKVMTFCALGLVGIAGCAVIVATNPNEGLHSEAQTDDTDE